ncbi:cytochrome b [Sulfitobacter sp. S0837]|uniref:cytochrome b n=1 Tax=Sulfitobacter maritimus TaxID=2741719 RepID=UPI001583CD0B|nr:cytochrome b [Sulfitobacter maritimus]NUH63901.1 cytochrome b [Sulfitobacter maritimus]
MTKLQDTPHRYGPVSRALHWGMAALFALQFLSAALHWALPRENAWREAFWFYHADLGIALFLLVLLRGVWGLANINQRPSHTGLAGKAANAGHLAIYLLMIVVPALRLLASAGSNRGLSFLGLQIFPPQQPEIPWTQIAAQWHGELGWVLALLVLGHIAIAVGWHHLIKRDGSLQKMT